MSHTAYNTIIKNKKDAKFDLCRKHFSLCFSCNCEFISQNYESTIRLQVNFRNSEFIHSFVSTFIFSDFEKHTQNSDFIHLAILNFYQPLLKFTSRNYILFSATVYIYIIEFRPYEIYFYISQLPFSPQNVFFIFIIVLESVLIFFFNKSVPFIHRETRRTCRIHI